MRHRLGNLSPRRCSPLLRLVSIVVFSSLVYASYASALVLERFFEWLVRLVWFTILVIFAIVLNRDCTSVSDGGLFVKFCRRSVYESIVTCGIGYAFGFCRRITDEAPCVYTCSLFCVVEERSSEHCEKYETTTTWSSNSSDPFDIVGSRIGS